ncbi:MAG: hypothetical protein DI533_17220 [Cereibacter sphaeroides]|uniref:Uncharacterized protein n=1 Tax=Cereibacter sphaeroides TaxID=1063 RepID=A0A2W5S252_CERSP|nr:MAG: hypothetical protein DI533_17220 [Cereibacter sphaeroides]
MSRFHIPTRVGPSPAAEEPGLQNSAARLRSSREAQSRLLAERRARADDPAGDAGAEHDVVTNAEANAKEEPGREREEHFEPLASEGARSLAEPSAKPRKEKLVVVFRLPLTTEGLLAEVPGASEVGLTYALRAFAKEGRAELRRFGSSEDLAPFTDSAKEILKLNARMMTVGESMTVYAQPAAIGAMHDTLGDPWRIEPRAAIVGAYLAAIVTRLIETRQAR